MADLIIKPATGDGNKLILQDKAGGAVLTTADSGATISGATVINTTGAITTTAAITGQLTAAQSLIKLTPTATASAPTGIEGGLYYDSTRNALMIYDSATHGWIRSDAKFGSTGAGGTITSPTIGGIAYKLHYFSGSGFFSLTGGEGMVVDILMVAGGGGAGDDNAGGGGAGGLIFEENISLVPGSYPIVIGAGGNGTATYGGGAGQTYVGADTTGFGWIAKGGGPGANGEANQGASNQGYYGGSGGGGDGESNHAAGWAALNLGAQGNNGGSGSSGGAGGGGGAGAVGNNASGASGGHGGVGRDMTSYLGTNYGESGFFAGGGAGGGENGTSYASLGGNGGGGNTNTSTGQAQAGQANTGGGAGGRTNNNSAAGIGGGSGVVIVRYKV